MNASNHYRNFHSNHLRNPLLLKQATQDPTFTMPSISRPRIHGSQSTASRWPLWVWAAIGIGIGLLIAVMLIFKGRGDYDFYKADSDGVAPAAAGPGYAPLPVPGDEAPQVMTNDPVVGSDGLFSGSSKPFIIDSPAPIAPPPAQTAPAPATPSVPAGSGTTASSSQADSLPVAIPDLSPAPEYPAEAYRNGESGTVRVRATVDPNGNVAQAQIELRSSSRALDRAALDAVKRWKFKPATRNGQRVQSDIIVPVEFNLQ